MKFPLRERPFDLVQLSPERLAELEATAQAVVEANLDEFHAFVHRQNRVMPRAQYKAIKKHDHITVYKELTKPHERVFGPLGVRSRSPYAPFMLNKLVACGTVRGRMDDMLLGTAVRDPASVVVKTSYVNDEIVDCSVLHEMQGASPQDPFRFLALKWIVKSKPSGINSVVAPRDMIVMQSSGLLASEGIGYHLLHSVDADVPECPPLEEKYGILRSRISTMFIFRQLAPDVIEVYTTNYVEPNGSAPEAVVLATSAKSMAASWKSLGYSHNVKLSWILRNKDTYVGATHAHHETMNTGDDCELCHKKATLTGRLDDCQLCDARVCSRCRVTKKLSKANRRLELKTEKFEFCKTCLYKVVNEDAVRIAAEMNVGVPITPWRKTKDHTTRKFSFAGTGSDTSSQRSRRDTVSTSSSGRSGRSRRQTEDQDLNELAYTKFVGRSTGQSKMRAPSVASSAYTDLNDLDDYDFHDQSDDDIQSIDFGSDDGLDQSFSIAAKDPHEKRKQELYLEYQRQLHALDAQQSANNNQQLQITPFRRHTSEPQRSRPPPPPVPAPTSFPSARSRNHKMSVDEMGPSGDSSQEHFHQLYAQMKSLQLAAEKTFELTRDNERKLSQGSHRRWER